MRVRALFPSSCGNDLARRSEIAVKHPHGQNGFLCGEIRKKKDDIGRPFSVPANRGRI